MGSDSRSNSRATRHTDRLQGAVGLLSPAQTHMDIVNSTYLRASTKRIKQITTAGKEQLCHSREGQKYDRQQAQQGRGVGTMYMIMQSGMHAQNCIQL